MENLKRNMIAGFIFVSVFGTLWHFIYEWTGDNRLIGFIAPINESTFEHMKLIFFPALLYLFIAVYFLKKNYQYIANAMAYGILAGTVFIPVFFYTYSGILGRNVMFIDIASFYVGVLIAFLLTYKLAKDNKKINNIGIYLLFVMAFIFVCCTYRHIDIGIFRG